MDKGQQARVDLRPVPEADKARSPGAKGSANRQSSERLADPLYLVISADKVRVVEKP
ncbi:MAG: hypothetical protein QM780_15315 [Hyphomicrobium sp.]|uniref:hypothetical protein n=1 Tax=Hyphomicrobium sp. TaxID=82 RepID=UPI0039E6FA28